jgi:hypothetical protein
MVSSFESLGEGGAGCWSCFDRSGYVLVTKRLERGRFARVEPTRPADRSVTIAARELALLLEGVRPR